MKINMTLKNGEYTYTFGGTSYAEFYLPKNRQWTVVTRSNGEQMLQGKMEDSDDEVREQAVALVNAGVCDIKEAVETVKRSGTITDLANSNYLEVSEEESEEDEEVLPKVYKDYRGKEYLVGNLSFAKEDAIKRQSESEATIVEPSRVRPDEHYRGLVQPIQVAKLTLTPEEFLGFLKGNVIKYTTRSGKKKGEAYEKDMGKAKDYYDWAKEFEEAGMITL